MLRERTPSRMALNNWFRLREHGLCRFVHGKASVLRTRELILITDETDLFKYTLTRTKGYFYCNKALENFTAHLAITFHSCPTC